MSFWKIFTTSLKLGLTSFGGPSAHLGFFQQTYAEKHRWLRNEDYAQLVALAQFLPGPASSQVGIGVGYKKGNLLGAIISFIGFTAPSALFLMTFALWMNQTSNAVEISWIHGLKLVSVVIVAHAVYMMYQSIVKTNAQRFILIGSLLTVLFLPLSFAHLIVLVVALFAGLFLPSNEEDENEFVPFLTISKKTGSIFLLVFLNLFIILPVLAMLIDNAYIQMIDSFYRAGSLVFGGGHVVLPLLQNEFVDTNLLEEGIFLAGYGMTQAMPGPIFTFATFIGTALHGVLGGVIATLAIFLPGFLLILGAYPFWQRAMSNARLKKSLLFINAAVVGLLAAAFIDPIMTSTITSFVDLIFILLMFGVYMYYKISPTWIVVIGLLIGVIFY